MARQTLTTGGFLARVAAALALVLLTFNPSGYSYVHWFVHQFPHIQALTALAGVVLLICWVIYLNATRESLGLMGIALLLAFFAALIWVAVSAGIMRVSSGPALTWAVLLVAGVILGIGMCWSHLRRRLTGQTDVEDVEQR